MGSATTASSELPYRIVKPPWLDTRTDVAGGVGRYHVLLSVPTGNVDLELRSRNSCYFHDELPSIFEGRPFTVHGYLKRRYPDEPWGPWVDEHRSGVGATWQDPRYPTRYHGERRPFTEAELEVVTPPIVAVVYAWLLVNEGLLYDQELRCRVWDLRQAETEKNRLVVQLQAARAKEEVAKLLLQGLKKEKRP